MICLGLYFTLDDDFKGKYLLYPFVKLIFAATIYSSEKEILGLFRASLVVLLARTLSEMILRVRARINLFVFY